MYEVYIVKLAFIIPPPIPATRYNRRKYEMIPSDTLSKSGVFKSDILTDFCDCSLSRLRNLYELCELSFSERKSCRVFCFSERYRILTEYHIGNRRKSKIFSPANEEDSLSGLRDSHIRTVYEEELYVVTDRVQFTYNGFCICFRIPDKHSLYVLRDCYLRTKPIDASDPIEEEIRESLLRLSFSKLLLLSESLFPISCKREGRARRRAVEYIKVEKFFGQFLAGFFDKVSDRTQEVVSRVMIFLIYLRHLRIDVVCSDHVISCELVSHSRATSTRER